MCPPEDKKASTPAPITAEDLKDLPDFVSSLPPLIQSQIIKSKKLNDSGQNLYPNTFRPHQQIADIRREFGEKSREELEQRENFCVIGGRLMTRRDHGKTSFITLQDHSGQLQLYLRKDELSAEVFELSKKLDIGDILGISGLVFKTKTGELTLHVKALELVTKALWPLPEKYHEIDVEMKYRRRYVDLIMNSVTRETFQIRSRVVDFLRRFMIQEGFIEVETPMLHPIPGGANALPFVTFHNALKQEFFLRIAPELYLKRLLVGGFQRVFELNRNFRNEGLSVKHNPEFTMLEFYQSYANYEDLMDLTERMLKTLVQEIKGTLTFSYQGTEISFSQPFERLTYHEALVSLGGLDPKDLKSLEGSLNFLKSNNYTPPQGILSLDILHQEIFDLVVEKKLINPTFITAYPTAISPLARKNDKDPSLTDRFELYIAGREMANAFSELNDPLDQYGRFLAQVEAREKGDQEGMYLDFDYIRALMYGMPPAAGEGLGIDRLVMLLTDSQSIRDVIFFPQMRPE
ncbi:MAG: lysine--tRNA ligase [Deltaproteobacteria bacterium]|jgi:lysyl-tRNA synthetase class 2|nr:lysine--tRNA ligase [Deltaproteobacteria bacterium]